MSTNTVKELKSSWSLKLSPRADAWDIEPVTDGHNAWRNDPTKIIRKEIPASFPATVPGCIHTDLISAGFIDDISINGKNFTNLSCSTSPGSNKDASIFTLFL